MSIREAVSKRRAPKRNSRAAASAPRVEGTGRRGAAARRVLRLAVPAALAAAAVTGVGMAAAGASDYLDDAPGFRVETLDVIGARRLGPDEAAALAGIVRGVPICDVDAAAARARLEADPRIASAVVLKEMPGTVRILVAERDPVALLVGEAGLHPVADDGSMWAAVPARSAPDLPVLTGFDPARAGRDPVALREDLSAAAALLRLVDRVGLPGGRAVSEVHRDPAGGLDIVTSDGQVVHLGRGPYRERLRRLGDVAEVLADRGLAAAEIHADGRRRPERITVRIKR